MSDRPIIFSAPMVRAILDGSKTQTRRVIRTPCNEMHEQGNPVMLLGRWGLSYVPTGPCPSGEITIHYQTAVDDSRSHVARCPYGRPGQRLWVRETWAALLWEEYEDTLHDGVASQRVIRRLPTEAERAEHARCHDEPLIIYRATDEMPRGDDYDRWRSPIHMPRWVSRITLEVTEVRVQRLRAITCADALAEGIAPTANSLTIDCDTPDPRSDFAALWDSINAKRGYSWEINPWAWAITFRRVEQ